MNITNPLECQCRYRQFEFATSVIVGSGPIEDGAFFKGGVDIVHSVAKPTEKTDTAANRAVALTKRKDVQVDAGDLRRPPVQLSA
jgi:hypothetical protein